MKKFLIILLIFAAALFIFSRSKDLLIKSLVADFLSEVTGTKVDIESFSLSIPLQSVKIRGLKVHNPKGFSPAIMADLPNIAVECDLFSLFAHKVHLPHLDIELKELVLEKNKEGRLNVDSLKIAGKSPDAKDRKSAQPSALRIDLLNLQIDRVVSKDYQAEKPLIKAHDVNLKKSYRNITGAKQLVLLVVTQSMRQAGIKGAEIYGIYALSGVAALPVAVTLRVVGKDAVQQNIDMDIETLYGLSLKVLDELGDIKNKNSGAYTISANIHGADVTAKLRQISHKVTQLTVTARKYLLPQHEIASGALYEILEELNVAK